MGSIVEELNDYFTVCTTRFLSLQKAKIFTIFKGMDSFGNLCGMTNDNHPGNHKYNGLDMTYRPNVFFFDFMAEIGENLDQTDATPGSRYSVEICVRECPTQLDSAADLINEYNQGNAQFQILAIHDCYRKTCRKF